MVISEAISSHDLQNNICKKLLKPSLQKSVLDNTYSFRLQVIPTSDSQARLLFTLTKLQFRSLALNAWRGIALHSFDSVVTVFRFWCDCRIEFSCQWLVNVCSVPGKPSQGLFKGGDRPSCQELEQWQQEPSKNSQACRPNVSTTLILKTVHRFCCLWHGMTHFTFILFHLTVFL